jgi:hypothetical protein
MSRSQPSQNLLSLNIQIPQQKNYNTTLMNEAHLVLDSRRKRSQLIDQLSKKQLSTSRKKSHSSQLSTLVRLKKYIYACLEIN